jgi:cytochrome c oxidase subunit II
MKKSLFLAVLTMSFLLLATGCRSQSSPAAERIKVVMKKYTIEPEVIRVKAGQTTELEVSTADVQHGFDVPGLSIKEPVRAGQPAVVTLKSPPKGEYKVVCGIICGPHHEDMVAKLVVE